MTGDTDCATIEVDAKAMRRSHRSSLSVFVINLEHDKIRRDHMDAMLARVGLVATYVPAVNGKSLADKDRAAYNRKKALRIYGVEMMDAEIGCYLSHYRLYERMVTDNIDFALIMEDDIEIAPDLPDIVEDLIADPTPAWMVVRFESLRGRVRQAEGRKFVGTPVKKLRHGELHLLGTHVLGLGAYLIGKEGAQRMLDYGREIFMPIDQTMDRYWENGIAPYIVRPLPVFQKSEMASRIGARPPGRHLGQPFPIRLQRRWQRLSDGFRRRVFAVSTKLRLFIPVSG